MPGGGVLFALFSSALDRVSKQMFLITASLLIGSPEFPQRLVGKGSEEQRVMFHINLPLGDPVRDWKLRPRSDIARPVAAVEPIYISHSSQHSYPPSGKAEGLLGMVTRAWVQSPRKGAEHGGEWGTGLRQGVLLQVCRTENLPPPSALRGHTAGHLVSLQEGK